VGDQHDSTDAVLSQQMGGQAGVVPGGARGILDPGRGNAVFALQDLLHDAALGKRAVVGLAAGDEDGQAAGAVQECGVAQAFQAVAVEGVAAVFGLIESPPAAEDDDGISGFQFGRADRGADFKAFLQQAADPGGGQGIQRDGDQQDQRLPQAGAVAQKGKPDKQQNHQQQGRQQGGGDQVGGKPGGHGGDCMPARCGIRTQCLTLSGGRS